MAEAAGDPVAVLDAVRAREMTLAEGGDSAAGAAAAGPARGRPGRSCWGSRWRPCWRPAGRSGPAYELGRLDLVEEAYGVVERAATASGLPLARWHLLRALASRAALEGRYPRARELNLAAAQLAAGLGDPTGIGLGYAHAMSVATIRGEPGDLLDGTAEMLASVPSMPLVRAQLASMLLLLDQREEAFGLYEELRAELGSMVADLRWGPTLFNLADLAVAFDDPPTAERWPSRWTVAGLPGVGRHAHRLLLRVAAARARPAGRRRRPAGRGGGAAAAAVRRNLALRARPYVALSRLELAAMLHRTGALAEAAALVRQAADDLRRLEMPGPLLRADRLAAAVARARDDADPLTAREREVADLVVRALSNRDIAARLVLSERTVESHVRSILAKLGCANRAELIARRPAGG